jgi:hypothetical protein
MAPVMARAAPLPKDVDGFLAGMSLIALDLDRALSGHTGKRPVASMGMQSALQYQKARSASLKDPHFRGQLVQYVNEVSVRVQAHRLKLQAARR